MNAKQILYLVVVLFLRSSTDCLELKELKFLINLFSGDSQEPKMKPQDIITTTRVYTNYSFLDYITRYDEHHCGTYKYVRLLVTNQSNTEGKRKPIQVKCLLGRGTGNLLVVTSLKEVVTLLAPNGNSTKRADPGNCALVLFYTKTCPVCAKVAPHFNAVSRQFPDIRIGAIDALKFHGLNTDFGIVGLPTIMLFHQGRPVIKFNDTPIWIDTFNAFITRHTGLNPKSDLSTLSDFSGPLSYTVEIETDYCLYLAWSFIIVCACYYFTKSRIYSNMIETIKRNWQESEAQHEHQR